MFRSVLLNYSVANLSLRGAKQQSSLGLVVKTILVANKNCYIYNYQKLKQSSHLFCSVLLSLKTSFNLKLTLATITTIKPPSGAWLSPTSRGLKLLKFGIYSGSNKIFKRYSPDLGDFLKLGMMSEEWGIFRAHS